MVVNFGFGYDSDCFFLHYLQSRKIGFGGTAEYIDTVK